MTRSAFQLALVAGAAWCGLTVSAQALSIEDFGSPQAFAQSNRSEFTVGLLELQHRFVAVFGGKCEGPPLDDDDKEKGGDGPKPPPGPPGPPGPGPGPGPGPRGNGVVTQLPDGGKAILELLGVEADRSIHVVGFDPLSERLIVTEFGGGDAGNAGNNAGNDAGNNAGNNAGAGAGAGAGGGVIQTAQDTLGAPPSAAYFSIANDGTITVLPVAGGESLQAGTDNATDAFIFPNNGFVFENPVVAPGLSLTIPVNSTRVVIIRAPGGQRFRVTVTVTLGLATIQVEPL